MANLTNAKQSSEAIAAICNSETNGLKRELATFRYVNEYLKNWADEATVGNDVRQQITTLNEAITLMMNKTVALCDTVDILVERQNDLNNGNV